MCRVDYKDQSSCEQRPLRGGDGAFTPCGRITRQEVDATTSEIAEGVRPWKSGDFAKVRKLQDAPMNKGQVDMMFSFEGVSQGQAVAVKRMPNTWVTSRPSDFKEQHPKASERPWFDLAILKALNRRKCPYVCDLLGVFRDEDTTYVVTSLATAGDLFSLCQSRELPMPGPAREIALRPLIVQIFKGVQWLHSMGVSHGDISLENIVLSSDGCGGHIARLIDFGLGTISRRHTGKVSGKQVYLPPEVYVLTSYDPRTADAFALGVVTFAAVAKDYPWATAKPGRCRSFACFKEEGLYAFLAKRKGPGGLTYERLLSNPLKMLLEGLLQIAPGDRWSVSGGSTPEKNESEATADMAICVWRSEWLRHPVGIGAEAWRRSKAYSMSEHGGASPLEWAPSCDAPSAVVEPPARLLCAA
mmetsp:Transcript_93807/g.271110  ORF Transcript_93807/g.271110 Transcript_93807/m.271110 type:complete len:415 (-) Transcript_93807:222-1466(-)